MNGKALIARNLEYFVVLYRVRSYADAARVIPITYQGLKKAIRGLEADLDVRLFEVEGEGKVLPTAYADKLFSLAQEWILETKGLERAFDVLREGECETVDLAMALGFSTFLGMDFAEQFAKEYPGLRVDAVEYADDVVDSMLLDGYFNLIVAAQPFNEQCDIVPLVSLGDCAWVSRNHRLASRERLTMADLDGEHIMIPNPHFKTGGYFLQAIENHELSPASVAYCTDIIHAFLFALENQGIGIGIQVVGDMLREVENVVCIPVDDGYEHGFAAAFRKGYEPTAAENALLDYLCHRVGRKKA